jgi:hypothetical protein
MTRWIVKLVPNDDKPDADGEALLVIPREVMDLAQWSVGDTVEISVTPSGAIVLVRPSLPGGR